MDSNQAHIDQIIKEKLDQFMPLPPEHVWAGIEQGLVDEKQPLFIFLYGKQLIAATALIFIALMLWYFIPVNNIDQVGEIEMIDETEQSETGSIVFPDDEQESQEINTKKNSTGNIPVNEIVDEPIETSTTEINQKEASLGIAAGNSLNNYSQEQVELNKSRQHQLTYISNKKVTALKISGDWYPDSEDAIDNSVNLKNRKSIPIEASSAGEGEMQGFNNYWNIGLYFTPEMMLNNIDSVTFMNIYSLNIEPSWYFNKHWFMRFGAGVSYVRDRGFAKVDYLSNDYIGTYDSVTSITYDTVGSELFRVYHTKEVEVWDSIRHLAISEMTNTYYYIQVPMLFGYHNSTNKFKWYFYGGPAVNISIIEQIEDPGTGIEFIEIVQLENKLPQRINYSLQLWVGAGIDFRVGRRFSLAFEPNYRYYFKPIYKENNYKTALSGLGLRFGLVYKLND